MFGSNSLTTRIAVGKGIGALIGLTAFFFIPHFLPQASATLHWGVFLWYIIFGAVIGVFGVYTTVPMLNVSLPCWFRGAYIGAALNLAITLIAYDTLGEMLVSVFGEDGLMISPFWMVLEGAILGLVIDVVATKVGGEGPTIIDQ